MFVRLLAYITLLASLAVSLDGTAGAGLIALPRARSARFRRIRSAQDPQADRHLCSPVQPQAPTPILLTTPRSRSSAGRLLMGAEFLPPFNGGTLTINAERTGNACKSNRLAGRASRVAVPEVLTVPDARAVRNVRTCRGR